MFVCLRRCAWCLCYFALSMIVFRWEVSIDLVWCGDAGCVFCALIALFMVLR